MDIPEFNTRKELFDFLVKNKTTLIAQKKAEIKRADAVIFPATIIKDTASKAEISADATKLQCRVVINTTNLMDSHKDVHMPGLWAKSLQENKSILHIQEHQMSFDHIISDGNDLKAFTQNYAWSQLGFNYPGNTEALVFDSLIRKDRNPLMFDQYAKGYVKNHSVGMQYVKLIMCVNDENYGAEYEAWQKYYPEIANKEVADEYGYCWVVKEAKVIEGSAVPKGSNWATPTLTVEQSKNQPEDSTDKHDRAADNGTHKGIDYKYLQTHFKI